MKWVVVSFFAVLFLVSFASAWKINGTVYDVDGNVLNNTNITVDMMYASGGGEPTFLTPNSTTSDSNGTFSLDVYDNSSIMYKIILKHVNSSTHKVDYIGQSLPYFPYEQVGGNLSIKFYLLEAGIINITAINSTGQRISFNYQIKDTELGYTIENQWTSRVNESIVYVPKNRNYSVMIYPDQSMPVSFDWNNFSSSSSYNFPDGLSSYNSTISTIQKTFNTSMSLIRVTGYLNNTNISGWDDVTIVPYILEPGNMVFISREGYGTMPYNMSSWMGGSDEYNLTTGFYNITLPGPAETQNILLFASARNGSNYYGSYKNISVSYGAINNQYNLTMYNMLGNSSENITMYDAGNFSGTKKVATKKQTFNFVNSSNGLVSMNSEAHVEVNVDYSAYGAKQFTFMADVESGSAGFSLPLLNVIGIKDINIFSSDYAPRRVSTKTPSEILANPNITLSSFNPGDIEGNDISSRVKVALYKSNSTCDVPNPSASCIIANSASMNESEGDSFDPLSSTIGGGKISFRMGLLSSGIIIEYVNVDMLASGPPDALFDDNATTSTSGGFESAMRFGSEGPTIYDYVLISMPYTEGSSSTTGLNESADVNISIPLFYDENWNVIWNSSLNGTNASALSGNYSHYSSKSDEWQYLISGVACHENANQINVTNPCYIDKTNNRIWLRLPHFSGTGPTISGSTITASSSDNSGSNGGSGGGGGSGGSENTNFWINTYVEDGSELKDIERIDKLLPNKNRIKLKIDAETHYVGVVDLTDEKVTINVSSESQQAVLSVGDLKKFDVSDDGYYDLSVLLNSINGSKANLSINYLHEKIPEDLAEPDTTSNPNGVDDANYNGNGDRLSVGRLSNYWTWIILTVIFVLIIVLVVYLLKKEGLSLEFLRRGFRKT